MPPVIKKASKKETFAFVALQGPTNSGKTTTMMRMLIRLAQRLGKKFGVIDTEHGRASKFIGFANADGGRIEEFDVIELEDDFSPKSYMAAINAFMETGEYCALGIDSLSHEWTGKGGILQIVDSQKDERGGKFSAGWGKATPLHNEFFEFLMKLKIHKICTMREEMKYEIDPHTKKVILVGLEAVQRTGGKNDVTYDFDVVAKIDKGHNLTMVKIPPSPVFEGLEIHKPGADFANLILDWLLVDAVTLEQQKADEQAAAAARLATLDKRVLDLSVEISKLHPEKDWWEKKGRPFYTQRKDNEEALRGVLEGLKKVHEKLLTEQQVAQNVPDAATREELAKIDAANGNN